MGYTIPTFNLTCDIWTGPWGTKSLRMAAEPCAMAIGRRAAIALNALGPYTDSATSPVLLLFGAGTDVRDSAAYANPGTVEMRSDFIEFPIGSGAWYFVLGVWDVGKGWPNEYRVASIVKVGEYWDSTVFAGVIFPSPMP